MFISLLYMYVIYNIILCVVNMETCKQTCKQSRSTEGN